MRRGASNEYSSFFTFFGACVQKLNPQDADINENRRALVVDELIGDVSGVAA